MYKSQVSNRFLAKAAGTFFFQAVGGIRCVFGSRGLEDVYRRQADRPARPAAARRDSPGGRERDRAGVGVRHDQQDAGSLRAVASGPCLLDSSDAAYFGVSISYRVLRSTKLSFPLSNISRSCTFLLYTTDAADDGESVDLGGRRSIKKKKNLLQH